jgi:hypothetical protein
MVRARMVALLARPLYDDMTLKTVASLNDDPTSSLPAIAS